jgi:hypothetical protein
MAGITIKAWIRMLVIGWSIVSVGIILVSYQVMKHGYVTEDYSVELPLQGSFSGEITGISRLLYADRDDQYLSKQQFLESIKDAKAINLHSSYTVKNQAIYLYLPIYSFVIWAFPILGIEGRPLNYQILLGL